ncbi:MAG: hypothetical protein J7J75_00725 [Euryarchaeota archaeon]|nr:hypothetical protein [Euryarchaeota archaeon]
MRDRLNPKGSEAPREGLPMRGPMKVNPYGIMSIERQGLRIKLIEYSQTLPQGELRISMETVARVLYFIYEVDLRNTCGYQRVMGELRGISTILLPLMVILPSSRQFT